MAKSASASPMLSTASDSTVRPSERERGHSPVAGAFLGVEDGGVAAAGPVGRSRHRATLHGQCLGWAGVADQAPELGEPGLDRTAGRTEAYRPVVVLEIAVGCPSSEIDPAPDMRGAEVTKVTLIGVIQSKIMQTSPTIIPAAPWEIGLGYRKPKAISTAAHV